jgi:vacuolar-type H+-ATPase subunit H
MGMDPAPRPASDIQVAADHVGAIVDAAERAAADMLNKAEARANERIAEADRASDNRVEAAEAEAREILEEAHREAAAVKAEARTVVQEIHDQAAQDRAAAQAFSETTRAQSISEGEAVRAEADAYALDVRAKAKEDAREVLRQAHGVAGDVMDEGTQLSTELHQLSDSLRRNAERLLSDIRVAHARLTAELDQARPVGTPVIRDQRPAAVSVTVSGGPDPAPSSLDVPEFIPPP